MKSPSLRLLLSTGTLAAALLFAGCSGGHKATPVAFSQTSLQAATNGAAYSQTLTVTGGTAPYTWTVSSGSLPSGMTLSSAGMLSGTPSVSGTFTFSITVTDASKPVQSLTGSYTLTVAAPPITITAPTLPAGTAGVAYSQTLVATGGTAPYTWTLESGTLPDGITLSSAGVLSGTPTTAGSYTFAFTVTDSGTPVQTATTGTVTLTIAAAPLTGNALLQGQYFFKEDLFADNNPNRAFHESYVGSLTFDGAGNITAGESDFADDEYDIINETVTGTYLVGNDGRGVLTLNFSQAGTQVFALAIGASATGSVATRARFVETDAVSDYEDEGVDYSTGFLQLQDPTAFTNASLVGTAVFGWSGSTYTYDTQVALPQQGGLALIGQLLVGSDLNLATGSTADIATNQATDANVALAGSVAPDATPVGSATSFQSYGRALLNLSTTTYPNGQLPSQSVIYVIDANTSYVISYPANRYEPLYSGYAIRQQSGAFTASSLNGSAIAHGASTAVNGQAAYTGTDTLTLYGTSEAFVSRYSADGAGNLTTLTDANVAGSILSGQSNTVTYTVAATGRTTFSGSASPILWLSGTNAGFAITQPPAGQPLLLTLDPQMAMSYSAANLSGAYLTGNQDLASYETRMFSGELEADGTGSLNGTIDYFTDNYGQAFGSAALTDQSTATFTSDGRFTVAGNYTIGGTSLGTQSTVFYMVSPDKAFGVDLTQGDSAPSILVLERGATPPITPSCSAVRPRPRSSGIHPDC